jgi:hypothetical protein
MVLEVLFEWEGSMKMLPPSTALLPLSAIGSWVGARTKSLKTTFGMMFCVFLVARLVICVLARN